MPCLLWGVLSSQTPLPVPPAIPSLWSEVIGSELLGDEMSPGGGCRNYVLGGPHSLERCCEPGRSTELGRLMCGLDIFCIREVSMSRGGRIRLGRSY